MALPTKKDCPSSKIIGKQVGIAINWESCGDVADPTLLVFKPLGGMQTKGVDRSQATEDVTDDATIGDFAEMIGTIKSFSLSASGFMNHTDSAVSNLVALDGLYSQAGTTTLHVRITEPHLTTYVYMIVSNFSKDWPSTAPITFELEMVATTSAYGVKVVETVPYTAPTALTLEPATLALNVGQKSALITAVTPAGAPQSVAFTSDAPEFATVSATGIVTAIAAGTANITAKSPYDSAVVKTCVVTVT